MAHILNEQLGYLASHNRLDLYRRAVEALVEPGTIVLDAGCGTAALGLLCLQRGAHRLYAVDCTSVVNLAQEAFTRSGWDARAVFVHGSTYQIQLPERVHVVICDHVGYFGFDYGLIALLADARKRFLKPGGKLIPSRLNLHLGAVESPICRALVEAWTDAVIPREYHWLRAYSVNTKHPVKLLANELISAPAELASIDLAADNPEFLSWSARLILHRDGVVHGLGGWFSCELAPQVWMTNSPLDIDAIDRFQAFLPIDEALPVKEGDLLEVTLMARPTDSLIAWTVTHPASGRRFSHSTWLSGFVKKDRLARSHPEHVPCVSTEALARSIVLSYCDGARRVAEIKSNVLRDHPHLFPTANEIERFVDSVLSQDTV